MTKPPQTGSEDAAAGLRSIPEASVARLAVYLRMLGELAEQGAETDGWNMTAPGGSYFVIGYGGTLHVPTLDIISTERNIIGNIVGTYNDLAELMALAQAGKVTLHTRAYPLTAAPDALADLDAGRVRGRAILVP